MRKKHDVARLRKAKLENQGPAKAKTARTSKAKSSKNPKAKSATPKAAATPGAPTTAFDQQRSEPAAVFRCSFCGKGRGEVQRLISGPRVFICNECVAFCNDILAEQLEDEESLPPPARLASQVQRATETALTDSALSELEGRLVAKLSFDLSKDGIDSAANRALTDLLDAYRYLRAQLIDQVTSLGTEIERLRSSLPAESE